MKNKFILALILAVLPWFSRAESFRSFTPGDGLSHCTTLLSAQDGYGMMWFGTEDGLNSFDGYSFKVYRNDKEDPSSVPGDRITSILIDSEGVLWVSAGTKIARYDRDNDSFTSWEHPSLRRQVRNIFEISEGKIGVIYEGQLWCFNVSKQQFETESIPADLVNVSFCCCCTCGDNIALGTISGAVHIWNTNSGNWKNLRNLPDSLKLRCLLYNEGDLWIGTEGDGLFRSDVAGRDLYHYTSGPNGLSSDFVRALCMDSDGRLWIGSYQGLDILQGDVFTHFSHNSADKSSLADNSIRTITKDNQGGMWIGSFYGGINYWHKAHGRFFKVNSGSYKFSETSNIQGMAEDGSHNIWMGVDYQTIARFDPSSGNVREYTVQGAGGSPLNIKSFYFDGEMVYLCSRLAGLIVLNSRTGAYYSTNCQGQASNISCLLPKDSDNLFLGTPNGILLYDKRNRTAVQLPSSLSKSINCILRDDNGTVWIGGNGGVARFEDENGSFTQIGIDENISQLRKIRRIFQTAAGDLYFCADRLCHYVPSTGETETFSVSDGLPTNLVSNIIEDKFGRLWLFTANGVCCHNPAKRTFKQYSGDEGLYFSGFGAASICKTESGLVYVGTKDGIMAFRPEEIEDNPFSPAPVITNVYNNSGQRLNGEIRLPWNKNTIRFEFSTFNYLSGGNDEFAFMLEGYDKDWRYQKGDNKVTYYNIPPGKYNFILKSANNDGVWCMEDVRRAVVIRPFFAYTPLAIIFYILLGISIISAVVYIRFQKQERNHLEEVHNLKVKFFINFLNELKTPLTLINSPLQEMIPRAESKWMRSQLRHVEKNSRHLLHLVNQLMLFRKAQLDVTPLRACRFNAEKMIKETTDNFAAFLKQKGIVCSFHSELQGENVLVDPQYLELILNNLLSNAVKFTDSGTVDVSSAIKDGNLVVEIRDTGKGISEDRLEHISDPYFNSSSESLDSGLGLSIVKQLLDKHHGFLTVESQYGTGSVFTAFIPQNISAYSTGEIVSETDYVFDPKAYDMDIDNFEDNQDYALISPNSGIRKHLLLVLSDIKLQKYLQEGLGRHFEVIVCENEKDAMSMCLSNDIDAVIVGDKNMDPLRLCKKIKADANISHIPVVILSSDDDASAQLNAFLAGASDFVSKPFSLAVLSVKINNMIASKTSGPKDVGDVCKPEPIQVFGNEDERFIDKVNAVINGRIDDFGLSIDEIVKEIGMSRSSFFLKIKRLTGLSPQDYIRNIRLSESCKLLVEGKKTIAEIAELTGFSTASYFSRAFKSYYGILPSKYRSQYEKKNK